LEHSGELFELSGKFSYNFGFYDSDLSCEIELRSQFSCGALCNMEKMHKLCVCTTFSSLGDVTRYGNNSTSNLILQPIFPTIFQQLIDPDR